MAHRPRSTDTEPAKQAASRGDWQESFELFMGFDADGTLDAGDVPLLGRGRLPPVTSMSPSRRGSASTGAASRSTTSWVPRAQPPVWRCTCCSTPR